MNYFEEDSMAWRIGKFGIIYYDPLYFVNQYSLLMHF